MDNRVFFREDSILELFDNKEQHKLGFVVPLNFALGEGSIYVANRMSRSMLKYSKQGELKGELKLPHLYSPDYFSLLPDKSLVVNDFHLDSIVQFNNGRIEYKAENSDLRFSVFENNFLFRKKTRFFDKKGHFNGEYKFTYLYSTFDYSLIDESSFGLIYYDEKAVSGVVNIIKSGGSLYKQNTLELPLDWEDYNGMKILKINEEECLFLLMAGINDLDETQLIHYNFSAGIIEMFNLKTNYTGSVFIGEGADLWSSGVLYKYSEREKAIYSLFTGDEFIYLYKYNLE